MKTRGAIIQARGDFFPLVACVAFMASTHPKRIKECEWK